MPAEELTITVYAADTAAEAVVLADYGEMTFDFSATDVRYHFDRHRRVKDRPRPKENVTGTGASPVLKSPGH